MNISIFRTPKQPKPIGETTISEYLNDIHTGRWVNDIIAYRNGEKKKEELEAHTLCGTFSYRKIKGLLEPSGFICMDFDSQDANKIKKYLSQDNYCYACWKSISGNGVAALFKINPKKHAESFEGLSEYLYKKYGIISDQSCKDVSRLRTISWDEDIYINEGSKKFALYLPPKPKSFKTISKTIFVKTDFDEIINQIIVRGLDVAGSYNDWVNICFAFTEQFGENGRHYFHEISRFRQSDKANYGADLVDKQFDSCLKHHGSGVTIGTFYWYCKQNNIDTMSARTQLIASAASKAKKGGRNISDTVKMLNEVEDIPASESESIVQQVFENNIEVEAGASIIDEIEQWLKQNVNIVYNEITNKHEIDGRSLKDRDYNSIFVNCKKVIDKIDLTLFKTIINSDRVDIVNPLKQWFSEHVTDTSTQQGCLEKLNQSINSPMDKKYTRFAIDKWFCGLIDAVYTSAPPFMLTLMSDINVGKTQFFRRLLPDQLKWLYGESKLDEGKDDALLMTQKWILLDDEMSGKSKKENAKFKSITSKDVFSLRRPFGHSNEDIKRLCMMAATTNEYQIIDRPKENRRILPIEIKSFDFDLYNSIDKDQLLIDTYLLWQEKKINSDLTREEIDFLYRHTNKYGKSIPEQESILATFEAPNYNNNLSASFLTVTQVKHILSNRCSDFLRTDVLSSYLVELGYEKVFRNGVYGFMMTQKQWQGVSQSNTDNE
ncbi:MAG TPA: VapE domain-containing protein, partial [Arachidicoccus soli]|nr:VapE domain-containing protein [Arachidicoccus soli]